MLSVTSVTVKVRMVTDVCEFMLYALVKSWRRICFTIKKSNVYITLKNTHKKSEVTVNLQTTKQGPNTWRGTHSKPDGTFSKNELDIIQHTMNILENLRGVGMFCLSLFHIFKTQKKGEKEKALPSGSSKAFAYTLKRKLDYWFWSCIWILAVAHM